MTIKELRQRCNYSQQEFCKAAGIRQPTASMWENGKSKPRIGDIRKIANVLGASVETILDCFTQ